MTAKQYLSQAARLRQLIKRTEAQIAELREMAESTGAIRYDKDMVQSTPTGDAMTDYMIKLEAAETRARSLISEYLETYMVIDQQIRQIMPFVYSDLLYLRYIESRSLGQIADELGYSYDRIKHLHGYALRAFDRKFLHTEAVESRHPKAP